MKNARHIKRIVEEDMGADAAGTRYSRVTVVFRWWYLPIAWFIMRHSKPVAGFMAKDE